MILKSFAWVEAISNLCFTNLAVCTLISHRHDKLHEYTYSSQWEKREDIKREYKGQKDGSFFSSAFEEAVPKLCEYIRGSLCATLSAFKTRVWGDPTIVSFSVCCLQRGREREKAREGESSSIPSNSSYLLQLDSEVSFKLMKTFSIHSCLSAQQSSSCYFDSTVLSTAPLLLTDGLICFPAELNRIRRGCRVFIEWWSVQSHHGHVPGAECVSGALGAPFAWCMHKGSCGGM